MEIKEVESEGEKFFVVRDRLFGGMKVVHPIKIDGKINWKNLIAGGSWNKLIPIGVIIAVIIMATLEYVDTATLAARCLEALPDYIPLPN